MSAQPAPIPSTREELSWKVTETYIDLLDKCEKGLITAAQLDCAVKALITATGWAVEKSVFVMLSDVNIEEDDSFAIKRIFINKELQKIFCVKGLPHRNLIEVWVSGVMIKSWEATPWDTSIAGEFNFKQWFEATCFGFLRKSNMEEIK